MQDNVHNKILYTSFTWRKKNQTSKNYIWSKIPIWQSWRVIWTHKHVLHKDRIFGIRLTWKYSAYWYISAPFGYSIIYFYFYFHFFLKVSRLKPAIAWSWKWAHYAICFCQWQAFLKRSTGALSFFYFLVPANGAGPQGIICRSLPAIEPKAEG